MKEDVLRVKLMVHEQIEELRLQMQKIASDKDLTDPRVVRVSERLDILINEFYSSQETIKRRSRRTG
ncbi:MAG TPA: aspartyl-phosphate phosphatase Spo0E family protein [Desulfosporosinus sp.]|nr:aspartyl-phosphate phosphatase Spo0E family protein [Desulfosporosinus sp.]